MLSPAWFFVTPWTAAHKAPLPMEFSRQEHWSGLPFPPPGDLPDSGTESAFHVSCVGRCILYHWATWEAPRLLQCTLNLALYEVPRILISWGFTGIKSKLEIHCHDDSWIWVTSSLHTVGRSGDMSPSWAAHRAHSSWAQLSSAQLIILHHLASTLWTPDFRPSLNSLHSTSLAGKVNSHPLVTGNRGGNSFWRFFKANRFLTVLLPWAEG